MSVNVFGSSGGDKSSLGVKYIDQKFVTLSTNLATKVNKSGDDISGDLNISLDGDKFRQFGVTDSCAGKSVALFLGDLNNKILSDFGSALNIFSSHGIKLTSHNIHSEGELICWFGGRNVPPVMFYKSVNMNGNHIGGLGEPIWSQDAATKNYVDTRFVQNSVGYIPILTTSIGKNGFIVSESSYQSQNNRGYQVFNRSKEDWIVADGVTTKFWIELKCPEQIRIYKFSLGVNVTLAVKHTFKLQGRNEEDGDWTDIFIGYNILLSKTVSFYNVSQCDLYYYYRIYIIDTENLRAPGLSYWQLYTLDAIKN